MRRRGIIGALGSEVSGAPLLVNKTSFGMLSGH